MRNWQFGLKDPTHLLLTSDYRFAGINAKYDNTWELQLESSDRGGIALYSTLSLRAVSLRIFPVFSNGSQTIIKTTNFNNTPIVKKLSTNTVEIEYEPFEDLHIETAFWLPDNQSILSKSTIKNLGDTDFEGNINWAVLLNPLQPGASIKNAEKGHLHYLNGQIQNAVLTFVLSGIAKPGNLSYPSLTTPIELKPKEEISHQWAFTIEEDAENSLEFCQLRLSQAPEAFEARMDVLQQRDEYQIYSTNPEWDAALAFSQKNALQLVLPDTLPGNPVSIIKSRNPEQQNAILLHDLPPIEKMSVLNLWALMGILPGAAKTIQPLLDRYMRHILNPNGSLAVQPYPLLADLIWQIYQHNEDRSWLSQYYSILIKTLEPWFHDDHDHDQDGIPEWHHAYQSEFHNLPIHNRWHQNGIGLDTRWIESPFLAGLLQSELQKLLKIAKEIETTDSIDWLENKSAVLESFIHDSFHPKKKYFKYRDSITHASPKGYKLFEGKENGSFKVNKKLKSEQRLTIHIRYPSTATRMTRIYIHGKTKNGDTVEEISARQFTWGENIGTASSRSLYTRIDSVEVEMLSEEDHFLIASADYAVEDITGAFPLWSTTIQPQRVKHLIERWLEPELSQPFGLPITPIKNQPKDSDNFNAVDVLLNRFVIEGLIKHEQIQTAAEIYTNLLSAVIKNLKLFKKFYKSYDASDGYGSGDYNIVNGLLPAKTFLQVIGVQFWSEGKIEITHFNPFTNPIRIQHRAMTLICEQEHYLLSIPGREPIRISGELPQTIRLK